MKMQMLITIDNKKESSASETIWTSNRFFGDQRSDLTLSKEKFLENTLIYLNQGLATNLKTSDRAIYLDYVVIAQILEASVCSPDLGCGYDLKENEVLMLVPLYNIENGHFTGLRNWLGYITIRGDRDEQFYSYGYSEERSKILCASMKQPLSNIFQVTAFKKHILFLIDCKRSESDNSSSKMFSFLPSTTDRKESINRYTKNVHLHPVDCLYDDFKTYAPEKSKIKETGVQPQLLDRSCAETRQCILNYMKHAIVFPNSNLVRNANALMQHKDAKIDKDHFE